jgi:hypothetical protein
MISPDKFIPLAVEQAYASDYPEAVLAHWQDKPNNLIQLTLDFEDRHVIAFYQPSGTWQGAQTFLPEKDHPGFLRSFLRGYKPRGFPMFVLKDEWKGRRLEYIAEIEHYDDSPARKYKFNESGTPMYHWCMPETAYRLAIN